LLVKLFPGHAGEVLVSDLKYSFYKVLDDLRATIFGRLKSLGYFRALPGSVKTMYRGIGIGVGIVGAFFGGITGKFTGDFSGKVVAAFLLSGLAVVLFAPLMPVKTRKGAQALTKVKGFEEFLLRAEKDRLERMKDQNLFEKYLPYAIALGVSDRWAEAFEGIYQESPGWYASHGGIRTFHPVSFHHSLDSALSRMGNAMYAAGGGGSSGGGGGGGGGGSW
jgi:uncharacterized membrane protein